MRAVLQRVINASVEAEGKVVGRIRDGLMVLLGVAKGDDESDARYVVDKIRNLRIFADDQGKMNRSLTDIGGAVLLVSQFTLLGRTDNGRRPVLMALLLLTSPSASMSRLRLICGHAGGLLKWVFLPRI